MASRLVVIAAVAALWIAAGPASAERPDPGEPGDAYLEIAAAVKQATGWEPILPLLSYEYRRFVQRRDPEAQQKLFAEFKRSLDLSDVVIVRQRVRRREAELDLTGKDAAGQPFRGTVDMEVERGAWKLDELDWSPIEPE